MPITILVPLGLCIIFCFTNLISSTATGEYLECEVSASLSVGLSTAENQQPGKASCVSVNWTLGDAQLEVVNTATGRRRDSGTPSRLCKHALFARWNRLYRKVRDLTAKHINVERERLRGGFIVFCALH